MGKIAHELLHSLGMQHEHVRADRDKFVHVGWENINRGRVTIFHIYFSFNVKIIIQILAVSIIELKL